MKTSILITTIALLSLTASSAFAQGYDRREDSRSYTSDRDREEFRERRRDRDRWDHSDYRQLRAELHQLNIMFARVNAHLRTFGGGRHLRWEFSRLLRDRDRLNIELERRNPDRFRIRMGIDRLRDQLRDIEVRLRVRGIRRHR